MYISEIELSDVRCFEGKHRISLARSEAGEYAGWTVFAGRNGSGKSSLLKALAMAVVGPLRSVALERTFEGWVRRGSSSAHVHLQLERDTGIDSIRESSAAVPRQSKAGSRNGGRLTTESGTVASVECGLSWNTMRDGATTGIDEHAGKHGTRHVRALQHGPWDLTPRGWFICGYGPFRHLGPPAQDVARLASETHLARLVNLFYEAASLVDAVDWLQRVHLRGLEGHADDEHLKHRVIALLNDGLLPDGSRVERVDSDGLWICRDRVIAPVSQISDGYRTVTALVLDIVRHLYKCYGKCFRLDDGADGRVTCDLPGVVLIDEIDAHMHVAWQQRIGFWMREHFPRIQFLVTTHSPFVCQAASPRGIVRLPAPGEQRRIEHVSERVHRLAVHGSIDEVVMTELFGLEHSHSEDTERVRERLASLEKKLLLGETLTDEEEAQMESLRAKLPDTLADTAEQRFRAATSPR